MSDDLISRKAVIEVVDKHTREDGTLDDDISVILEEVETALDKEKVIEELNEKADYARNRWLNSTKELQTKYWEGKENGIREAIEIVEKGGIE